MYKFAAEIQIRSQGSRLLTLSAPHINHNPAKMIKKILPDLIAILAFVLISFAYFFPADIEGRILFQHDTAAGAGAGQEAKEYYEQTGERTRWTNSLFGGMPTYQISPSYDSTVPLQWTQKIYQLFLPTYVNLTFILMLGFYILRHTGMAGRLGRHHVGLLVLLLHSDFGGTHLEVHHPCLHPAHNSGHRARLPGQAAGRRHTHSLLHRPANHVQPRADVLLLPVRHPVHRRSIL